MANSIGKFWLPDFSVDAHFIVHCWPAGFTVGNGVVPEKGTLFDKSLVDEKTLRRMYADRWIAMVDEPPPAKPDPIRQLEMSFLSVNEMNLTAIKDRNDASAA